ncbi:MAG: hypothetical protein ABL880_04070 [Methylotenera sp.]
MQNNYTLKQAVITALTMLAVGTQSQALALGLGNIDVKSHLGQPLRASIQIQGAGELKDSTCFKVINDSSAENQLNSANFKLSKAVEDVAILTVTTNQIINEPIVNLSVMAECDINMRRDYVLLLDPILTAELETAAEELPSNSGEFQAEKESLVVKAPIQQQTVKVAASPTKKASTKKRKNSNKSNGNIVLTAGYNSDKPAELATPSSTNNTAPENKPRLSISAGDAMSLGGAELRLDRMLHFTPETAPQALTANTDALDEATVMSHRLAHLEKQLNSLVLDNKKLKTENTLKTEQLAEAKLFKNMVDWLGYVLGGLLLIVSYTVADKLRRRRQAQQLETAQLEWENTNHTSANLDKFDTDNYIFELDSDADFSQKINSDDKKSAETPSDFINEVVPFSVEEFNSEHNVLDHADVFLSHGRTSLAIQLLQNHLLEFPKQSVTIWMFLLDLLAKENLQAVYEQTALECKEYFNVQIAEFSKSENDLNHSLESFPRITAGLQQAWGTPAALVYLDDLIYNSRLEVRVGFHKNVIEELLMLKSVAQEELKSAEVIQLDEKKLAMLELKEAQLNAKKEEKLRQMDEEALKMATEKAADAKITPMERFEFNLIEYK